MLHRKTGGTFLLERWKGFFLLLLLIMISKKISFRTKPNFSVVGWTKPCSSVMSLAMELPPAELHCLFSLKSFRLAAQWSETLLSPGLRWWLLSVETGKWFQCQSVESILLILPQLKRNLHLGVLW